MKGDLEMRRQCSIAAVLAAVIFLLLACAKEPEQTSDLRQFPMDDLGGIIDSSVAQLDNEISSDGHGAVKISVPESTTVRLLEVSGLDIQNARLVYQARVRTEALEGLAYLEMLCHFPGKGDFFSRGLQNPLTGTSEWTTEETPFFLKEGENPDTVRLNLVVTGRGTVWIDDIHLQKAPLQ
jgi:hypothetical protein